MNWACFAVAAWIALGLDLGLRDALAVGASGVAPSFALALLVVVAAHAPKRDALWAGLILGLALDLTRAGVSASAGGAQTIAIIGPAALGGLLAAQLIVTIRAMMMRRSPLALAAMGFAAALLANLVVAGTLTARSWYDPAIHVVASAELTSRLGASLYTGLITPVVALLCLPLMPLFAFAAGPGRTARA